MAQALKRVYIVGVGMTKFTKPGTGADYPELGLEAVQKALKDARLTYKQVQQAVVGYVYGDSTCGQRALYSSGLTGIPIYNVNNNCATGSSALHLAKQLVSGSQADCVLALGFEKMERGSIGSVFANRTNPMDKHVEAMGKIRGIDEAPLAAQLFGSAGKEHMDKYGTKVEHFAKIAQKNHNHGTKNPNSQFQTSRTLEEILSAKEISNPLTKLMCCPTSDGGAAALVASEDFVKAHNLQETAVEILAMELVTDFSSTFDEKSMAKVVGYDLTKTAGERAFQKSGRKVSEVQVVELHDCFSANELLTYEALGLCEVGKAGEFIDRGDNTYGGKYVVNPSGGLISKGHPLGATGLAQAAELCWQLRGEAGDRQVKDCKLALAHNLGLGGAVVVSLLQLGFPTAAGRVKPPAAATGHRGFHTSSTRGSAQTNSSVTVSEFKCAPIFQNLENLLKASGESYVNKLNCVYEFKVDGPSGLGTWSLDVKNGNGNVQFGETVPTPTPDVVLSIRDGDLCELMTGKFNAQTAFFEGKLKIKGNIGLAMKLNEFLSRIPKV